MVRYKKPLPKITPYFKPLPMLPSSRTRREELERREELKKKKPTPKRIEPITEVRGLTKAERIEKGKGILTDKERLELAQSRAKPGEEPTGIDPRTGQFIYPPEVAARTEAWEAGLATREQLEAAGAFEQVTPTEVPLSPELKTDIPVLTPTLGAAAQFAGEHGLLGIARDNGWLGDILPEVRTGEEAFPVPVTEETLREAALRQISINAFNEGTTNAEKFGAFMELLPGIGQVEKWVGGVIESPYPNAIAVMEEISTMGSTATNLQEKTRSGILPAADAMARAREMEERMAWLEGRLKLLINESKILQANTDKVNEMMQSILDMKTRIDNFRTSAAFALTAEMTGTGRPIPTDEGIYFELKDYNEKS